jgi:hypothetical protein
MPLSLLLRYIELAEMGAINLIYALRVCESEGEKMRIFFLFFHPALFFIPFRT